jgi:uncharacterized protein
MGEVSLPGMFATIDAQDWAALPTFFHPDMVYERPGFSVLRGLDEVLHFYHVERGIRASAHRIDGMAVQDGAGAAWGEVHCVLADGRETDVGFADTYRFADKLIIHRRTHFFVPAV